tara:strand:+ start:3376 stop:3552 length:177 start_codon:yes stop_codon:yes gene_type:complete
MKIALQFSGQPRFIEDKICYISIKNNILDKYDCDVFCHFWWDENPDLLYDAAPWSNLN